MLTIQLTLLPKSDCVSVAINAVESHSFPLSQLTFSPAQAETFFDDPSGYGKRLYRALFPLGSEAEQALKALPGRQRLFLHLTGAALTSLPWEYCFDGQRYLATEYGFARCVPGEAPLAEMPLAEVPLAERLRFLFVPADPLLHGAEVAPYRLGLEREWDDLLKDLRSSDPAVDLIQVQPPTFAALQTAAAGMRAGILHFTGHGAAEKDRAYLLFEKPSGAAELVEAAHLAALVRGKAALVVLSACQSAAPGQGVEANLAALLSAQGLPFVLGMQLSVPDRSARAFTDMFYHHLFAGEEVYEAARQARLAILQAGSALEMGIPVLYSADPARPAALKPAGKGLQVAAPPRINLEGLPTAAESGFFGRQRELAQVGALLSAERLRDGESYPPLTVTLHGPGGIGKTALLLKAAARFAWAFEGVLAVPLEPPPTPESLCERLEKFCGLPEGASLERGARLERLSHGLQGRSLLLALDNFESLLHARAGADEAKKHEAAAIFKFLRGLPARGLTLLVSSRAPSGLPGEKSVEIPGLDDSAGARLFAAGVSGRKSALETQALKRLSRRVGGHPLALKLLAPRFDGDASLGLVDFIDQLETLLPAAADEWDEGQRHDTLRACFDFSLEALQKSDPALVNALARLSVFSAAFTDWLAAPVLFGKEKLLAEDANQNGLFAAAAQNLHHLWESSQLEREIVPLSETALTFYNLHPALRPFAAARLAENDKPAALDNFFNSMRRLGRLCYPFKEEGGGIYAHYELALTAQRALPDLRRAAEMKSDAGASILRIHTAFLFTHFGDLAGAMQLYQQALAVYEGLGNLQGKSASLHQMAGIFATRGDLVGAMQLYQQALAIQEGLDDLKGKSATLHAMANVSVTRGNLDGAMKLYLQSLEIKEGLNDLQGKAVTLHEMANIYRTRGDLDGAMQLYQQSLEIKNCLGNLQGKASTLHEMAYIYITRGDLAGAMKLYRQSFEIESGLGDLQGKSGTLHQMAYIHTMRGDLDGAMQLYQQALAIQARLGDLKGKSATLLAMVHIYRTRGDLSGAMELCQQSLEIDKGLVNLMGKAATLHEMAIIYRTRGDMGRAMELCQQSLEIKESLGDRQGKVATLHEMAHIHTMCGDLNRAMQLYQQALAINESLGDLRCKAAILHAMAHIHTTRGELNEAMKLYQQALDTFENLDDLQGKAITLGMMGRTLWAQKYHKEAIRSVRVGLMILVEHGMEPQTQQAMASDLRDWRSQIGPASFDPLWREVTGGAPIPEWLEQAPSPAGAGEQEQGMSVEQFIAGAVSAARKHLPEAEGYFKSASQLAANTSAPSELRALGAVLHRILGGDLHPDLSSLPP